MDALYFLFLIPLAAPWLAKWLLHTTINWLEMAVTMVGVCIIISVLWFTGTWSQTSDIEIVNGEVTGKDKVWVSCSHSYPCNCRTSCSGSGTSRSCHTICDTCHEHLNDWDWRVYSNIGSFNINRIDRRGSKEPPRWTKVEKAQPVSLARPYTNYIKAVPESLFHEDSSYKNKFANKLPTYPSNVYDYHYVDRVLSVGAPVPDLKEWNKELPLVLRQLGPTKQANVIIVFTAVSDSSYSIALREHWLGGKKNDIVVVIGAPRYPLIEWVSVFSWTDNELFKVQLRDAITEMGTIDRKMLLTTIETHTMKAFVRKKMEDFEYLKKEIRPPTWVLVICIFISIFGTLGLTYFFHRNELTIDGLNMYNRYSPFNRKRYY